MNSEAWILLGTILLVALAGVALKLLLAKDGDDEKFEPIPVPDLVTPEQLADAQVRLERLPHFLRLCDGDLLDLFSGAVISACDCGQAPEGHRLVAYSHGQKIGLIRRQSMAKYVAAHEALGRLLDPGEPPRLPNRIRF